VAIDGDTIVSGAVGVDLPNANDAGALYVFARTGPSIWTETAKLTATDAGYLDSLGRSVGIAGDTIIGGAPGLRTSGNSGHGNAYTFARTGAAARTETAKLIPSDIATHPGMGNSVGIDGDTIVVGAAGDLLSKGRVYTFTSTGDPIRAETATLTPSGNNDGDMFGMCVAIDGTTILAGAPKHKVGAKTYQARRSSSSSRAGSDQHGRRGQDSPRRGFSNHSYRNAASGSIAAARRAGNEAATTATAISTSDIDAYTVQSVGVTPNRIPCIALAIVHASRMPGTKPISTSRRSCCNTSRATSVLVAPSAIRMPISRVRCANM
jgi:hypothetical protein